MSADKSVDRLISEKMKGQMSLEMIIGLLILLVVAFVVIRLFLTQTGGITNIKDVKQSLKYGEFKQGCDQLCKEGNIIKWCSTKMTGDTDLNRNQRVDATDSESLTGFRICEDGIYCMNMFPCATDTGKISPTECKQTLCSAYYESFQDMNKANEKVKKIYPGHGTCIFNKDEENWYTWFEFSSNAICGGSSGSSGSSASVNCVKGSDGTSANCNWSCPNTLAAGQSRILGVTPGAKSCSSQASSGTCNFPGLTVGTTYNVGLVCDSPAATIYASTSITI